MNMHHLGIETQRLDESIEFYKKFGFEVESIMELLGEKLVFLKLGVFQLELVLVEESLKLSNNKHIAFEVEDLDVFLEEHAELNVSEGPYQLDNGWKNVFILGPSGESIELLQTH
ncbi:VOC family protein [Pseudalkalibacillus sp. Hm43]|uniref:VOC family protein n=1 Tax=Pseudalkalibacillus sp. Hm43 TaxID=3450742 RepID=UPI003F423302